MGTDGDALRHHLQTWMAQLNPNCIRATRGAGQDLTWESSGKESCPEPGWRRENAKPLRTATLPDGAKWPRRTPDCLHSRRGKGRGDEAGPLVEAGTVLCSTPLRDPGSPCQTTQPRRGALARVPRLRRPYLGPSPNTEDWSNPALRPGARPRGDTGRTPGSFLCHFVLCSLSRRRSRLL